ncbi:hypothetical protein TRSC58_07684 [Trypanosoma rangeli SC58]|uniref:Uncharacterized protein n=1 Tax=Trypanosoma rangeli SC58 TaxID=429131 RepID=A0A061IRP3_TRYRA|nr:hypothetical protein TRSC58_07684 [Trypanosoma rangeli SC58]
MRCLINRPKCCVGCICKIVPIQLLHRALTPFPSPLLATVATTVLFLSFPFCLSSVSCVVANIFFDFFFFLRFFFLRS